MVSQFVSSNTVRLLGDLEFQFPEGTHAIGRLDSESEGLLLLTTNKKITTLLFAPKKNHTRTYLVMVKDCVSVETLQRLKAGIPIKIKGGEYYKAVPNNIEIIENPFLYYNYAEDPRAAFPHTWLLLTLTEGKYHQVRKMVFTAGHRCFRLIRLSIGKLHLNNLPLGEVKEIDEEAFFSLLNLN